MNREMRRMAERQERRQKKQEAKSGSSPRAAASARAAGGAGRPREQADRGSLFQRIARFLHDVRVEMRKVSWPTRDQMVSFTIVTVVTTVVLTILVFGLDAGLKELVFLAIGQSNG